MEIEQAGRQKQKEEEAASQEKVGAIQDKCVYETHHLVGIGRVRIEWLGLRERRAFVEGHRDGSSRLQRRRSGDFGRGERPGRR